VIISRIVSNAIIDSDYYPVLIVAHDGRLWMFPWQAYALTLVTLPGCYRASPSKQRGITVWLSRILNLKLSPKDPLTILLKESDYAAL